MFFKVAKVTPGTVVTVKALQKKKENEIKLSVGERPPVDFRSRTK